MIELLLLLTLATGPDCHIGLALSGGGALGLAHIGVVKVLEAESIPFCYVSGNSMGSIVGGMYACGYSGVQMESIARVTNWIELFNDQVPYSAMNLDERETRTRYVVNLPHHNFAPRLPSGVLAAENVYIYFKELSERQSLNARGDFDRLVIPYRAIGVDFMTGEKVVFRRGSVADAMRASMAIPGIFAPHYEQDRVLVDGGVIQFLPVEPLLEFRPDFIIASDVRQPPHRDHVPTLVDLAWLSTDIMTNRDHAEQKALADVVIWSDLKGLAASDFMRARELIRRGEAAARAAVPELRRKLAGKRPIAIRQEIPERPLPVVRAIQLRGLRVTRSGVVRREIRTRPGETLDLPRLLADVRAIHNTGLFSQVTYRLEPVDGDTVTIEFNVQEKDFGIYRLGLHYDQTNQFRFGAEVAQENLLGSGAGVSAGLVLGNPRAGWLRSAGNRFFGLPFNYRGQVFASSGERRYSLYSPDGLWHGVNHRTLQAGAELKMGFNLGRNAWLKGGAGIRELRYHIYSGNLQGDTLERLAAVEAAFKYKNYWDLSFPRQGLSIQAVARYAPDRFMRGEVRLVAPFALGRRVVVEPNFSAGALFNGRLQLPGLESVPVAERFFEGGPDLAGAGFEEFGTGQKLQLGLDLKVLLSRLFHSADYPLYLDLQGDVAGLVPFRRLALDNIYYGAYAGLTLNTPAGPVRAGYGRGQGGRSSFYVSAGFDALPDFSR